MSDLSHITRNYSAISHTDETDDILQTINLDMNWLPTTASPFKASELTPVGEEIIADLGKAMPSAVNDFEYPLTVTAEFHGYNPVTCQIDKGTTSNNRCHLSLSIPAGMPGDVYYADVKIADNTTVPNQRIYSEVLTIRKQP